ncbi:MAG: squalene/phytoene synthase family protein [Myxococcota bacterium]
MHASVDSSPFGPLQASPWVRPSARRGIDAVDHFARKARAIVASDTTRCRRLRELALMEDALRRCFHGEAATPAFATLRTAVRTYGLPHSAFQRLLAAARAEVVTKHYATFDRMIEACEGSAKPIGQLVLLVHGHREPALHRFSDALCTGLRLAVDLRDLEPQLERGRCVIPQEDLVHFQVERDALSEVRHSAAVRELLAFQAARARSFLERGAPLLRHVAPELRSPLAERVGRGLMTLDRLTRAR